MTFFLLTILKREEYGNFCCDENSESLNYKHVLLGTFLNSYNEP